MEQDIILAPQDSDLPFTEQSVEPVVSARNLTKSFGEEIAVNDVTFDFPRGTIFGFIGPSGSGKTTTIRLLTGIHRPTSGEVNVLGYNPIHFPRTIRAKIGYMPQLFFLYPQLTVWENINFVASMNGMNLFRRKILHELLEFVELQGHERKRVADLSGGMRRRLSLATTLVQDPTLIFLDEPTAGIDPVLRRKFWTHFQGLKEQGKTLFVTTQYVGEAAYCDFIGVMKEGRLLMVDTPDGIRRRTYGGDIVDIVTDIPLQDDVVREIESLPFVKHQVSHEGNDLRVAVDEGKEAIPDLMEWFGARSMTVSSIEEFIPPFDDVFVELIEQEEKND